MSAGRYFTSPRGYVPTNDRRVSRERAASDDWNWPLLPDIHVPEHRSVDTGLLDARGDPIWRAPNPIGFGRDGEW